MRRHPILALLVLVPVLSLLASCGASGGTDTAGSDAKTTTSASASDDDGTDEPADETTTTAEDEDGDDGDQPSTEALVDLLPTADEIGPGYEVSDESLGDDADDASDDVQEADDADDEEDPLDKALVEQCPGAEFLDELDDSGESTTEVSRSFENESEATVEVALDPKPPKFTEDTVGKIVEALADCGTIEATDDDGAGIKMTLKAEEYDDQGDFGIAVEMDAEYTLMGSTIPIEFRGVIFSVDGTAVSVIATSGLDGATYALVPGDYDLLPDLAATMEERVASL